MHVTELTLLTVELSLKRRITHASATRTTSQNLVARCRLANGLTGWGEGVPRDYVTGETTESAHLQFAATDWAKQLQGDCQGWSEVIALCERLRPTVEGPDPRGCRSNALRCAVELSVLDAFGRNFRQPLSAVTDEFEPATLIRGHQTAVRYSTTITADSSAAERIAAWKMRLYGFRQCKVKVGLPEVDDAARLRRIRRWLGTRCDLRVDANEAWSEHDAADRIQALLPARISSVEQPVPHAAVQSLAEIRRQIDVPLMLDESLTSVIDARSAICEGTCDLFNIRLSKCGGFLNSLRLAALASEAGLGYQLGCHPGESGILSAAGRHFAVSVREIRYLEGSYDRHLLLDRLTQEDLTFRFGGRAPALPGAGLGVTIDESSVSRLVRQKSTRCW